MSNEYRFPLVGAAMLAALLLPAPADAQTYSPTYSYAQPQLFPFPLFQAPIERAAPAERVAPEALPQSEGESADPRFRRQTVSYTGNEAPGTVMADDETRAFYRTLMAETLAVGRAQGVPLSEDYIEERMKFSEAAPKGLKASMYHDLERGNRLELDWLAGTVVELARKTGVPVPANEAVYTLLKLHRMGNA